MTMKTSFVLYVGRDIKRADSEYYSYYGNQYGFAFLEISNKILRMGKIFV